MNIAMYQSFLEAISAEPLGDFHKLAGADWLAEAGHSDLEFALRWCAAHRKWPCHRTKLKRYKWEWLCEQSTMMQEGEDFSPGGVIRYKRLIREYPQATLDEAVSGKLIARYH